MRPEVLCRKDYTAEEAFWLHPPGRWELIHGEVVFLSPTGARHGLFVQRLARYLGAFVEAHGLGQVLAGDAGFVLRRKPDTVRAPDVAVVRRARLPDPLPEEYFEGAPDLAIEVMSPDDRWPEVQAKVQEYLRAGSSRVWVIDANAREARIYDAGGSRVVAADAALEDADLLPGFALPLADLFR
jgi:Uma2 family endonuclease